jgi:hypothetical protein
VVKLFDRNDLFREHLNMMNPRILASIIALEPPAYRRNQLWEIRNKKLRWQVIKLLEENGIEIPVGADFDLELAYFSFAFGLI